MKDGVRLSDAEALDEMVKKIQSLERWDPRGIEGYVLGETLEGVRDLLEQTGRSVPPAEEETP